MLELELEDQLPAGQLRDPDGAVRPFHGWLELMSAISDAIAPEPISPESGSRITESQ